MFLKIRNTFNRKKSIRVSFLLFYDILAIIAAEFLALLTRFDFSYSRIGKDYLETAIWYTPFNLLLTLLFFVIMKLYSSLWRYAGIQEFANIIIACILAGAVQSLGMHMFSKNMPRSYYILCMFYLLIFTGLSRFCYRGIRMLKNSFVTERSNTAITTMIIGAGDSAYALIKDIQNSYAIHNKVVCAIDADKQKVGSKILGVPIVGNDSRINWAVEKYHVQEIFVAIPNLPAKRKKKIIDICKDTGCRIRTLPSVAQIVNNEVRLANLREVGIEDLLGREPVQINLNEIMGYIKGKTILITGAGGSIGSELCRQIAEHNPQKLVVLDIYENTIYDLQLSMAQKYPNLDLTVLIASVRNSKRVNHIFSEYRPDIVFHAAAHKHVPLMEDSPNEAIKNNVFGTYNVAKACAEYGTHRMVLISTDKAVNPTNIMGASKRICEMVIQGMAKQNPGTNYAVVRFGNVLGSNGSVIPLFKKQIAEGGPVTVTDKDIIRYFMTIPEAVSLVLQAGVYAKGGEIFVLDMGEPVKIDDMARNLIKLSGFEPDVDIPVIYTGLRPGEKLFEECLKEEEGLKKTANNLIFIGKPIEFDDVEFFDTLAELKQKAYEDDPDMKYLVKGIVPSYQVRE